MENWIRRNGVAHGDILAHLGSDGADSNDAVDLHNYTQAV
jgi:hypothetical protein